MLHFDNNIWKACIEKRRGWILEMIKIQGYFNNYGCIPSLRRGMLQPNPPRQEGSYVEIIEENDSVRDGVWVCKVKDDTTNENSDDEDNLGQSIISSNNSGDE